MGTMKTALIIAVLYLTGPMEVIHECHYKVTFVAGLWRSNNTSQKKTITITVNRKVTLELLFDGWLTKRDGPDLNEDGIVNWFDFAIWAQERR